MSKEIGFIWKNGNADIALIDGSLPASSELESNILVSLFTDARSKDATKTDRRGYWGSSPDVFVEGSLIWEYFREPASQVNLQRVISTAKTALKWLIDKGIASDIDIEGSIFNRIGFALQITVKRGTNKKYAYLWRDLTSRKYDFDQSAIFLDFKV